VKEKYVAGATMVAAGSQKGVPILLEKDANHPDDSFLTSEMKYARRYLYSKGVLVPEEGRNPVDIQFDRFFECVKTGSKPLADVEVGLADSTAVILSNMAMEQDRKIYFNEMDKLGKAPENKAAKKA
jgi:hypothetical protein